MTAPQLVERLRNRARIEVERLGEYQESGAGEAVRSRVLSGLEVAIDEALPK